MVSNSCYRMSLALLTRIVCRSLVLQWQGSVSISMAHVTTKGYWDIPG